MRIPLKVAIVASKFKGRIDFHYSLVVMKSLKLHELLKHKYKSLDHHLENEAISGFKFLIVKVPFGGFFVVVESNPIYKLTTYVKYRNYIMADLEDFFKDNSEIIIVNQGLF